MPVPDQVRDDGFGIHIYLNLLDSRLRESDKKPTPLFLNIMAETGQTQLQIMLN